MVLQNNYASIVYDQSMPNIHPHNANYESSAKGTSQTPSIHPICFALNILLLFARACILPPSYSQGMQNWRHFFSFWFCRKKLCWNISIDLLETKLTIAEFTACVCWKLSKGYIPNPLNSPHLLSFKVLFFCFSKTEIRNWKNIYLSRFSELV